MIRDISQRLAPALPVWPGDTAFALERTWTLDEQTPVNVSRLTLSTHTGTHADAPLHYRADGAAIDVVDLAPYIGECVMLDVRGCGSVISPEHIVWDEVAGIQRVLLRTYDAFPHETWDSAFVTIAAATIVRLAAAGVRLIGIDSPSLDPEDSVTLAAHHAVAAADMRILEGLVLDDVPAGRYELIALPLKIAGADASPVRAILRDLA